MVTKVFNIQPVLFHQYYLCHLLWFKKQSFTLVWKPNPPLLSLLRAPSRSCWCSECSSTHEALPLKVHLFMWSVKSDSCYNVLWLCNAQTLWSSRPCTCTSATTSIFFTGGGFVRLTAKPRYLLLHHRGKEKSNTVTALVSIHLWTPAKSVPGAWWTQTLHQSSSPQDQAFYTSLNDWWTPGSLPWNCFVSNSQNMFMFHVHTFLMHLLILFYFIFLYIKAYVKRNSFLKNYICP